MSVEKIILRSLLSTLLAIVMLFVIMIGALVAVFPETMMNITYDMGMEKSSVWFAERAYDRHQDIDTIAFATTVAIEEDLYDKIISCGEKMIADEEFSGYCADKDLANEEKYGDQTIGGYKIVDILGKYDQYIYAQISIAQYKTGDTDAAVESAVAFTAGFPRNNAIACLLLEAHSDGDEELEQNLVSVMENLNQEDWDNGDRTYYNEIYSLITNA